MSVLEKLTEEEMALVAILQDQSGIDILEFARADEEGPDGCWRAWPLQVGWWREQSPLSVVRGCRSIGKSMSVVSQAVAFPFNFPGDEMVITAPEANHLDALTDKIETAFEQTRLFGEMLNKGRGGVKHRPFLMSFAHGGRIMGRIPQRDGRGVKGAHPLKLIVEESQDYPDAGYLELIETLKRGQEHAQWKSIGVTTGQRNWFWKVTQPGSGWKVHTMTAMSRPTWSEEERGEKVKQYGSEHDPDYRRNVWGDHGDATSPIFRLASLMERVDPNRDSIYNTAIFYDQRITGEMLEHNGQNVELLLDPPALHRDRNRYTEFWGGADIGFTLAPTEITIFGWRAPDKTIKGPDGKIAEREPVFELVSRINLSRVDHERQLDAILWAMRFYDLEAFGMDSTGVGLPIAQALRSRGENDPEVARFVDRLRPYNWSSKVLVDIDEKKAGELNITDFEEMKKHCGIFRNPLEHSTDELRKLVDSKRIWLPWNDEIVGQFQGQTFTVSKSTVDGYGRKRYSAGSFHILDGARMAAMAWSQSEIEKRLLEHEKRKRAQSPQEDVVDLFL